MKIQRLSFAITLAFILLSPVCRSQVIHFQSAGFAGTTSAPAGTTTKTSMSAGGIVSQSTGQSNRGGFMWGNVDYRPALQSSAIAFSGLTNNQLTITWVKGNGQRRIVVAKAASAVNASPASAAAYTANAAFGSGTQITAGNYVVYDGTGNSVTVSNLSPSVVYYFKVFEYNGKYGSNNANIEYQPGDLTGNPSNRTTLANQPTATASGFLTSGLAKDQMTIQWANGNGTNRVVLMKAVSTVDGTPVDGSSYTANSVFGNGTQIGTGNFVVFSGGGNSVTVTNLLPNTTYFYQVFELNGTGADDNYLTPASGSSQLTLTPAPVASAGTLPTQSSFNANWQGVTGTTGYFLDVSTDPAFGSFVTGYNNKSIGTVLTSSITGLTGGTVYNFRLRSNNAAGQSANSNVIQVTTVPATPEILTSTAISSTGFTTNWSTSTLTDTYIVDISNDAGFTQLIDGFNAKQVTGTSVSVSGLQNGTNYFIRVKAQNASGTSPYSTTLQQITKTAVPEILDATNVNSNAFKAKWGSVTGATGYDLEVSTDEFTSNIAGYPKSVSGTENIVQGLLPETVYQYRVRGVNAAGESEYSAESLVITQTSTGEDAQLPQISSPSFASNAAKAIVKGGIAPIKVYLKHRPIAGTTYSKDEAPVTSGTANIQAETQWLDELGMEYYFVMEDGAHRMDSTEVSYSYQAISVTAIPGFENGSDSYKMFSLPASISGKRIDDILQPIIAEYGGYDKTKWRMFHYQSPQYVEYTAGLETMDPGSSYWIVLDKATETIPFASQVVNANQESPFTMNFQKGWNQIGSPYPFNIDWSIIQSQNPGVGLNSVWTYTGSSYQKSTVLKPWSGAFVFSDNGGSVVFPVTSKTSQAGRVATIGSNPDDDEWQLPVELTLGELKQKSAIGMHPSAQISKDAFDEITLPRFNNYLELSTYHKDFFAPHFMIDMVPTSQSYEWKFTAESNDSQSEATISWDQDGIARSASGLILIDIEGAVWTDMKTTGSYNFEWKTGKEFIVAYNKNGEPTSSLTLAGQAFPNPFKDRVTIPLLNANENQDVTVLVYDMLGRKIKSLSHIIQKKGEYKLSWDGRDDSGNDVSAGMLFYRVQLGTVLSKAQRIIKE